MSRCPKTSNGKRARSSRAIDETEIDDALVHSLPLMAVVTVNLVAEELAAKFGVAVDVLKDKHRDYLNWRIPQLLEQLLSATDTDTRGAEDSINLPGASLLNGECVTSTSTSPVATAQSVANRQLAAGPKKKKKEAEGHAAFAQDTASKVQAHSTKEQPSHPRKVRPKLTTCVTAKMKPDKTSGTANAKKSRTNAPSKRALTNLKDLASVAGLLSPRSKLSRSLKEANNNVQKDVLLRAALNAAQVTFKGPYPTQVDIRACKDERDRLKELEDIDAANILPATETQRPIKPKKPRLSDPLASRRADPLYKFAFSDDEEKEDDSDASAPSIHSLSD